MDSKLLKSQLNKDLIVKILQSLNCHSINLCSKHISCGLPNGDNKKSVCVYTDNDNYYTQIFTRNEFQSLPYKDIITFVSFINNTSSQQAIKYICDLCDIDYYIKVSETPAILKWLDFVETGVREADSETFLTPLPDKVLNQFLMKPIKKWTKEGITSHSQTKYQIGFDLTTERIVIPIRDEIGNLVGVKGRLLDDTKVSGDKYMYIYNCPKSKILYGLHKNYAHIKKANEVIVVEGEKSVIKLNSLGYKNAVAVGSKHISQIQIEKLQRLCVPITLAFDKDVDGNELQVIIDELKTPLNLVEVYILNDVMNFLDKKDSPCDDSKTWNCLYKNFKYKV